MSLSDLAEPASVASSSTGSSVIPQPQDSSNQTRINLQLPTSFIVLPLTAGLIGLSIGIVRGGGRARLRFLAENAHRPPKTIQGWYFYTKTRNYRVFFGAAKTGARYALRLGGATAAYVVLDESIGWTREQLFGLSGPVVRHSGGGAREFSMDTQAEGVEVDGMPKRNSWRVGGVKWQDGALAGGIMGVGVGTAYRLPRQLFIRSVVMGLILGGSTSALQVAQAHIGKLREAEVVSHPSTAPGSSAAAVATTEEVVPLSSPDVPEQELVAASGVGRVDVDLIPLGEEAQTLWDKIKGVVGR